jgi:sarcosine oxidase
MPASHAPRLQVIGIERFEPAHSLGSSHGLSRITRLAYFEAPQYVALLRRSFQLWHELEQETGQVRR